MPFCGISVIHGTSPLKCETMVGARIPLNPSVGANRLEMGLESVNHFSRRIAIVLGTGEVELPPHLCRKPCGRVVSKQSDAV